MNTGVEILLKRIKDCPDDFQYDVSTDRSTKWNKLLMEALRSDVITEEEKSALKHEVTEMGRARFTEKVMQTLAGVEDETSDEGKLYMAQPQTQFTIQNQSSTTGTVRIPSGTITLGNTTLDEFALKKLLGKK